MRRPRGGRGGDRPRGHLDAHAGGVEHGDVSRGGARRHLHRALRGEVHPRPVLGAEREAHPVAEPRGVGLRAHVRRARRLRGEEGRVAAARGRRLLRRRLRERAEGGRDRQPLPALRFRREAVPAFWQKRDPRALPLDGEHLLRRDEPLLARVQHRERDREGHHADGHRLHGHGQAHRRGRRPPRLRVHRAEIRAGLFFRHSGGHRGGARAGRVRGGIRRAYRRGVRLPPRAARARREQGVAHAEGGPSAPLVAERRGRPASLRLPRVARRVVGCAPHRPAQARGDQRHGRRARSRGRQEGPPDDDRRERQTHLLQGRGLDSVRRVREPPGRPLPPVARRREGVSSSIPRSTRPATSSAS